jgi:signal transduction histidine kinase
LTENTIPKTSCRVTAAILHFAASVEIDTSSWFNGSTVDPEQLADTRAWVDAAVACELWTRLVETTGNHEIAAEVALHALHKNVFGSAGTILRLLGTLPRALQKVGDIAAYFTNFVAVAPRHVGTSSAMLETHTTLPDLKCYHHLNFLRGLLAGLPTLWRQPMAHVEITRFEQSVAACSPIDDRVFHVEESGEVFSHPSGDPDDRRREGALDEHGGFVLNNIEYGASAGLFRVRFEPLGGRSWLQRVFSSGDELTESTTALETDLREMERLFANQGEVSAELKTVVDRRTTELQKANHELAELAAKLERQSRFKSEFVADFSHELRTLMTSIVGYADLLSAGVYGDLNERQVDACHRISLASDVLLRAINDLLDLAKLQAGQMDVFYEDVSVRDLLEETVALVLPLAEEKGLDLQVVITPETPPRLYTDVAKLKNILLNLLGNAVKFTTRGHIALRAELRGPGTISFAVEDTGQGVDEVDLPLLFEEFAVIDRAGRTGGRPGMGLRIVKKLVDILDGSISVGSRPGSGSEFTVSFPVRPVGSMVSSPPVEPESLSPERAGRTVVVADSSQSDAAFFRLSFQAVGLRAEVCHDGREIERRLTETGADLLVIDPLLPHRDGWQVLQQLRSNPQFENLPVILVGENIEADLAAAYRVAAAFTKPVGREALVRATLRLLGLLAIDDEAP